MSKEESSPRGKRARRWRKEVQKPLNDAGSGAENHLADQERRHQWQQEMKELKEDGKLLGDASSSTSDSPPGDKDRRRQWQEEMMQLKNDIARKEPGA
ncbi:hypothetical protein [Fodinibius sediminis]|uniref:Uncharacterized protein n=1 Tax=Fodinibius sediminis TaxID=1214077 RepID=A0A521FD77_9BACT|nr:hypothetical protein [Fodinibius sediminis]SMO94123.1 hypothetical protein SAMN06265218_1309 [Fodinibius sediminis]